MRRGSAMVVTLCAGAVLAGCGDPDHVTYVDPNPESAYSTMGGGASEPFNEYGAAAAYRATTLHRLRGELELASVAAAVDVADVPGAIAFARRDAYEPIRAELVLRAPTTARAFDAQLAKLEAPGDMNAEQVRASITQLLARTMPVVQRAVVPRPALQDEGFRAAVVAVGLMDAATDAESAIASDGLEADVDAERRAYAVVLDARTRGVRDIPLNVRSGIADRLATLITTSFARTQKSFPGTHVATELNEIADNLTTAAQVDPITPVPAGSTPGLLRAVKQAVAAAIESVEQGDRAGGLRQLRAAATGPLDEAASGVASVDPDVYAEVQRMLVIDLPDAVRSERGVDERAASLDTRLDDAIGRVEDELEAQRAAR